MKIIFKKTFTFLLALCVITLSIPCTAYGYTELSDEYDMAYYSKFKDQDMVLNIYNWGEYMSDGAEDTLDVNKAFEALTGIDVVYSTYDTNETLYAKLKTGGSSYDLIIPSDYMIARMIDDELIQPINFDNVPNFKNIDDKYKNPVYDPTNAYSIPYSWGTVGLIYNTTMIDPNDTIDSWTAMWSETYRDSVLMFANSKDAYGIAFKILGMPINAQSAEQLEDATDLLKQQKSVLQAYVMDEIFDKMIGGEAALAPYYAGDALTMIDENPDLAFVIPKEGSNIFTDGMCIPTVAKNKEAAEMYINFLLEPEVGLANIEFLGYSTPNKAVYEILDEETKNNPIAYPSEEILDTCEYFTHVDPDIAKLMDQKWTEVLSSDETYNQMLMPMVIVFCLGASIALNIFRSIRRKKDKY